MDKLEEDYDGFKLLWVFENVLAANSLSNFILSLVTFDIMLGKYIC